MTGAEMTGAERISAERARQIAVEGYTLEHDQSRTLDELARAAQAYLFAAVGMLTSAAACWPFEPHQFKPSVFPERNVEKAGAFTAAILDWFAEKKRREAAESSA